MNVPLLLSLLEAQADPWIDPQVSWASIFDDLQDLLQTRMTEAVSSAKVELLANKFELGADAILAVAEFDPTDGKCLEWLLRHAKAGNLRLPEDGQRIHDQLATYFKLKLTSAFTGEKDLNKLDPGSLYDTLQANAGTVGKKDAVRQAAMAGVKKLATVGDMDLFEVTTPEAGAKLWRDTNWCVRDPVMFRRYGSPYYYFTKAEAPAALYHIKSRQFKSPNDRELNFAQAMVYMDLCKSAGLLLNHRSAVLQVTKGNSPYSNVIVAMSLYASLSPEDLADMAREAAEAEAAAAAEAADFGTPGKFFTVKALKVLGKETWEARLKETGVNIPVYHVLDSTKRSLVKASSAFAERLVEQGELGTLLDYPPYDAFRSDPMSSPFIRDILLSMPTSASPDAWVGSFITLPHHAPELEPILLRHPTHAFRYATSYVGGGLITNASVPRLTQFPGGRWPEVEPLIPDAVDAVASIPEGENAGDVYRRGEALTKVVRQVVRYFDQVKEAPPPEVDRAVLGLNSVSSILDYAKVFKDRHWPEAEALALRDPNSAFIYARDVIGKAWPEAERVITKDGAIAASYAVQVLQSRWPAYEDWMVKHPSPRRLTSYLTAALGNWENAMIKHWPEGRKPVEELALAALAKAKASKTPLPTDITKMVDECSYRRGEPWPELEPVLRYSRPLWSVYKNRVDDWQASADIAARKAAEAAQRQAVNPGLA